MSCVWRVLGHGQKASLRTGTGLPFTLLGPHSMGTSRWCPLGADLCGSHRSTHIAGDLALLTLVSQAKPQRESESQAFCIARYWSGTCKRGRQKGASLICSDLFWKQFGTNRKETEQIETNRNKLGYSRKQGAQIGTNGKKTGKSEQIGTNRGDPLLPTPKRGLRYWKTCRFFASQANIAGFFAGAFVALSCEFRAT